MVEIWDLQNMHVGEKELEFLLIAAKQPKINLISEIAPTHRPLPNPDVLTVLCLWLFE